MCRIFIVKPSQNLSLSMSERIEISEYICEGVVEPSYKKTTRADANHSGLSTKISGKTASSSTYSYMSKSTAKRIKRYVYHRKDISRLTCLIHDIHKMNVRSWETSVLIILKSGLISTMGVSLYIVSNSAYSKRKML